MKVVELYWKMQFIQEYLRACLYMNGLDSDVIRKSWERNITNDSDNYININFEDILITYDVKKKKVCDTIEVYNKEGIMIEVLNVYDYLKKEVE